MKAKFIALAALVLGLASCQTDVVDGVKVDANGEAPVTLQVALPEDVTRAAGNDSAKGAIGNIDLENTYDIRYVLNVYDEGGKLAKGPITEFQDEATSQSFSLRLVPGRYYKFVVWADFVLEGSEEALHYDVTDFAEIKTIGTHNAMDESRDAYTGFVEVANFKGSQGIDKINLTRPFAKLRVVTTDIDQLYSNLQSATVVYTTKLYTTFNAVAAEPTGLEGMASVTRTVDFTNVAYQYSNEPVQDKEQTLFADYFFGAEDDRVMFTLNVTDATNLPIPQVVFNTNIPVQRNYLTTVKGNVLTDANNITVEIKDAFEGEYTNGSDVDTTESFSEALKAAEESVEATIDLTGDVVWATGAGHGSTPWIPEGAKTQKLTVNANGHKITATGAGVGAIRMANGGTLVINNATIEDKSESYAENSWEFGYLEFGGKLEFNECEFVNAIQLEEQANATFNKCSFNSNKTKEYAVWVCGNKAYFNECAIEGPRGIKMHEDYGSEVEEVVINNCEFNGISEKPGVAMGDLNAETKVVIKNSTFTNCQAGDQGLYIYETDTDVTTFNFIEENNTIVYATDSNDAFNEAIVDGMSYISLGDGEFNAPAGLSNGQADNTLTIVGNGIDNTIVNGATNTNNQHPGNYAHDLDLVLENLTFVTTNNGYNGGFGHAKSVTFRNCKIVGQFYAHSGAPHYFYDCIIDPLTGYLYTYSSNCVFERCSFSASEGKALQIYADASTGEHTVTITDCEFVAAKQAQTWDGKPVTGIDINSNGAKFTVAINGCTATGFPAGLNSKSTLWNVKDGGKAHATVTVDGLKVWDAGYEYLADGILSKDGEYLILNKTGLFSFANEVNANGNAFAGKTVKLTANIDLNNEAWTPVGQTGATTFNGVFDGQEYTISNLNVNSEAQTGKHYSSGLFGWVESHTAGHGHIKNVKIKGATIIGHHNCGALVGYITQETALVENCHVTGAAVTCTKANNDADGDKAGALIGNATNATPVKDCTAANSTVSAGRDAGQVIGAGKEANVTGCSATNVTVSANGTGTGANVRNEVIGRLLN